MNAATSPYGVLSDIPIMFVVLAFVSTSTAWIYTAFSNIPAWVAPTLLSMPILVCITSHIALRDARKNVLAWLSTLPFPLENVNAILCSSGEHFEITFRDTAPSRQLLMEQFELASNEVIVLDQDEERNVVTGRFGVIDSKRNPYGTAYRRYTRMRDVVSKSLVPLHEKHAIERILIV